MEFDSKKKIKSILRNAKNKNNIKRKKSQVFKKIYLDSQAKRMERKPTAPEVAFEKILKEIGIDYTTQKIVGFYIYDFYIPSLNLLCEVDGDYFHSNPIKYEVVKLNEMQKRNKIRDQKKTRYAKGCGYVLERFWETDILNNPSSIKEKIENML